MFATHPQVDGGKSQTILDDRAGKSRLPVKLQRARMHDQRARRRPGLGLLVDDAHANAEPREPQREDQAGRSGARNQHFAIGHEVATKMGSNPLCSMRVGRRGRFDQRMM